VLRCVALRCVALRLRCVALRLRCVAFAFALRCVCVEFALRCVALRCIAFPKKLRAALRWLWNFESRAKCGCYATSDFTSPLSGFACAPPHHTITDITRVSLAAPPMPLLLPLLAGPPALAGRRTYPRPPVRKGQPKLWRVLPQENPGSGMP
jgi:hypothetical protein